MKELRLVDSLILLSQLAHDKERAKQEGLKYIEVYKKNCNAYQDSDITVLMSTLNQLDIEKQRIADRCNDILHKLLKEPIVRYSFVTRGILSKKEIEDGYVVLTKKTLTSEKLTELFSKEFSDDVKLLILTGVKAGTVLSCIEENGYNIQNVL